MPKTVLVVDDDADAREIYSAALTNAGYKVVTAMHGAEGVHLARRVRPQLILMDLRMPLMDGRSSLRYIRADPATRSIPVWALSAFIDEEESGGSASPQFNRLITKPSAPEDLVAAVAAYLGPPGGSGGSAPASEPRPEPAG